eukprot:COSAG02_NODE_942_length_15746_cov_6.164632_10_plen_140_part_00
MTLLLQLTLYLVQLHIIMIPMASDVPLTDGGKAFTLLYVPMSVVMVAAAIQRVANVPLKNRQSALEDHVLSEFGKGISRCVTKSFRSIEAYSVSLISYSNWAALRHQRKCELRQHATHLHAIAAIATSARHLLAAQVRF